MEHGKKENIDYKSKYLDTLKKLDSIIADAQLSIEYDTVDYKSFYRLIVDICKMRNEMKNELL